MIRSIFLFKELPQFRCTAQRSNFTSLFAIRLFIGPGTVGLADPLFRAHHLPTVAAGVDSPVTQITARLMYLAVERVTQKWALLFCNQGQIRDQNQDGLFLLYGRIVN